MDHILFTGQKSVVTHIHHINSPFIQKSNEKHTVFKNIVSKQLLIQSSLILPIVKPMYLNS